MPEIYCDRCGLGIKKPTEFCPACGLELCVKFDQHSFQNNQNSRTPETIYPSSYQLDFDVKDVSFEEILENKNVVYDKTLVGRQEDNSSDSFLRLRPKNDFLCSLGWRKLVGTVIVSEPPYMTKPLSHWTVKGIKILFFILFFPVIVSVLIATMMASFLFSFLSFGRGARPGFISSLASQVIGFFLIGKLFGPKDQISVRDVRIRDKDGNEHLIRIAGELIAGNFNVGDEIEAQGFNRRGTLIFSKGRNYRTGSEIIVKKR